MNIALTSDLKQCFPDLNFLYFSLSVVITKKSEQLETLKQLLYQEVKQKYALETLKQVPIFRAYRDFFWKIGIDPTKSRPAAEALVRRILAGKQIPTINTFVDAYNLASIKSEVALAAFDADKVNGDLTMRFASKKERFFGIGMRKHAVLTGKEVVVSDTQRLLALYPHRDADYSKITEKTRNVLTLVCGVPKISLETLFQSKKIVLKYIEQFCNGVLTDSVP